jgi:hypothetical protein
LDTLEKASRTIILLYSLKTTVILKEVEATHYNIEANANQLLHQQNLYPRNS